MGHDHTKKQQMSAKLRLVRSPREEEALENSPLIAPSTEKPKSAFARQLTSFADDLDREIQALLNS